MEEKIVVPQELTNRQEVRKLLKEKDVVAEIQRHLWIESEKAGYDIGFQTAAEDWIRRFSSDWIEYHSAQNKRRTGSLLTRIARKTRRNKSSK